jgi:hypothetical protein
LILFVEMDLTRAARKNPFDLVLLLAAQRRSKDRPAVTAEVIGNDLGIAYSQDGEDRGVSRLDCGSNAFDEFVGNAELVFPRRGIEGAGSCA